MRKIKALGIAPYKGLAIQLKNEALKRDDIDIDVFTGDLEEGVGIARRRFNEEYDIIISRGGTASLLEENGFPVIDISISLYDILRSLRMADDARKKYAIIGFPTITKNAVFLQEVLPGGMDIEIITTNSIAESEEAMRRLKQEGVTNIVCDMTGARSAGRYKLNFILINSGVESISAAIDQAVKMGQQRIRYDESVNVYKSVIEQCPYPIILFNKNKIINNIEQMPPLPEGFIRSMQINADSIDIGETSCLDYDDYGSLYSAIEKKLPMDNDALTVYYITQTKFPFSLEENGISVRNSRRSAYEYERSFFAITNATAKEIEILESFIEQDYAVLIAGEPGTGKGPLLQYLYISSRHSHEPLYDIDCGIAGRKVPIFIRKLLSESPELKAVINLKNIDKLSPSTIDELIELNEEHHITARAYIIASATQEKNHALNASCLKFINRLQCLTLTTSPLREHPEDLPNIANLYINYLNRSQGSNVTTIEESAFEIMKAYDWPFNNDELARILKRLTISVTREVITAEDISRAIEEEKSLYSNKSSFDCEGKTLKEIEKDIVKIVLEKEQGNRSITARKLGISRSTLWRILQEE